MTPQTTAPPPASALRRPVPDEIVDACDDLVQVLAALQERFSDPIDGACLEAAAHLLSCLADVHRPGATPDLPAEDLP